MPSAAAATPAMSNAAAQVNNRPDYNNAAAAAANAGAGAGGGRATMSQNGERHNSSCNSSGNAVNHPTPQIDRESQQQSSSSSRKVHVLYYLSRAGQVAEQPHLLEFTIAPNEGLYLRDVKKRLAMIRGSKLATTFSWSYRRNYKNMPVWQDLCDDDLIFPASGCEYMLKGSEILTDADFSEDAMAARQQHSNRSSSTTATYNNRASFGMASAPLTSNISSATLMVEAGTDAATQTEQSELPADEDEGDDINPITAANRNSNRHPHSHLRQQHKDYYQNVPPTNHGSFLSSSAPHHMRNSMIQSQPAAYGPHLYHTSSHINGSSTAASTEASYPSSELHPITIASPPNYYTSSLPNTPSPYYNSNHHMQYQLQQRGIIGGGSNTNINYSRHSHGHGPNATRSLATAAGAAAEAGVNVDGEEEEAVLAAAQDQFYSNSDRVADGDEINDVNAGQNKQWSTMNSNTVPSNGGSRTQGRINSRANASMRSRSGHNIHQSNTVNNANATTIAPEQLGSTEIVEDRPSKIKHSSNLSLAAMIDLEQLQQQDRGVELNKNVSGAAALSNASMAPPTAAAPNPKLQHPTTGKHSSAGSLNLLQLMSCGSLDIKDVQTLPSAHHHNHYATVQQQQQRSAAAFTASPAAAGAASTELDSDLLHQQQHQIIAAGRSSISSLDRSSMHYSNAINDGSRESMSMTAAADPSDLLTSAAAIATIQQLHSNNNYAKKTKKKSGEIFSKAVSGEIVHLQTSTYNDKAAATSISSPLYNYVMSAAAPGKQQLSGAGGNNNSASMKQMLLMEQGARSEHHPSTTAAAAGLVNSSIGINPTHHHHGHHKVASMPSKAFSEGEVSCMVANIADLQQFYNNSSAAINTKSSPNYYSYNGGETMAQIWEDLLAAPAKQQQRRQQAMSEYHYYHSHNNYRRPPPSLLLSAERALQNAVDMSLPPIDHVLSQHHYCPHCGKKVKSEMMKQHLRNCNLPKFNNNSNSNVGGNDHHHKGHSQNLIMLRAMNSSSLYKRLFRPSPK